MEVEGACERRGLDSVVEGVFGGLWMGGGGMEEEGGESVGCWLLWLLI